MTKISATLASIATLALAAIPAFAIGSAAHAATIAVKTADLNLDSPEGARELDRRIDVAAGRFCAKRTATGTRMASGGCKAAVRAEVVQKIAAAKSASASYAAR